MCVCSFKYPACKLHAPYFLLSPARLYNIFPHYLIKGMIFGKKNVSDHKMYVLIYPTTCV